MAFDHSYYQPYLDSGSNHHAFVSSMDPSELSPWSPASGNTGAVSPIYHHGPALMPKPCQDRTGDSGSIPSGPVRSSRSLSSTRIPSGFMPYPSNRPSTRCQTGKTTDPQTLDSPISPVPAMIRSSWSATSSPLDFSPTSSHSASASIVDAGALRHWRYSSHYQLPNYMLHPQGPKPSTTTITPITPVTPDLSVFPTYSQGLDPIPASTGDTLTLQTPPSRYSLKPTLYDPNSPRADTRTPSREFEVPSTTTLLSYLTSPAQPISLVRNVSVVPTRGMRDYFWWDIRNLRAWTSFSIATFDSLDKRLIQLLKTEIPSSRTPKVEISPTSLAPESEPALVHLIQNLYAPKLNAALAISQGEDHLQLYLAPDFRSTGHKNHGQPHFLANYASDTELTSAGLSRGRLVGIVKSFDRWNSGMRNEAPHRRVEYLNGLAHLQRCMREHSSRYGFIITETELVCVRAGCDLGNDVPYFGYLELAAPIPLQTASRQDADLVSPISKQSSSPPSLSSFSFGSSSWDENDDTPMTASLALYFLLMLSKSVPLPNQPSAYLNVGRPSALTRQRILPEPKDKWIPEPQIGERRDAKRVRGWIWPMDAWHRREAPKSREKMKK